MSRSRSGYRAALPRAGRVLRVLARRGFLGAMRGRQHWPAPTQVRAALEELGVVYVKFGQVLALRRDLLPPAYIEELEGLHDRLPTIALADVRAVIEGDLGNSLEALFASFDEAPLAAASIAQVHGATLSDGRPVVVKVRRPGLEERIADDIAALTHLAALAEQVAPRLRSLDLVGMVREFSDSLRREMDLSLEARTIRRFRQSLAGEPGVWIPDAVPELTGERVLTLEHSPGARIDAYADEHPEERQRLAAGVAALVLHQVFETGLFNADPHPGNLFVLPDGRLCLHDFGMIGELDARLRDGLTRVLEAVVDGNARAMTEAYLELGVVGGDVDRQSLEASLAALLRRIRERPLAEISVADALESVLRVGSQHRIRNPGQVLLLARAFLIAEAVMRRLDPDVNVVELFGAEVRRIELRRYAPERLLRDGRTLVRDLEPVARGTRRRAARAPADRRGRSRSGARARTGGRWPAREPQSRTAHRRRRVGRARRGRRAARGPAGMASLAGQRTSRDRHPRRDRDGRRRVAAAATLRDTFPSNTDSGGSIMQRILVIDDDAGVTSTLKRGLAYEGYAVDTAPGGMQGLALARDHAPDLVILDVMMPGLDGHQVLARLKSADKQVPVLMLTARDEPGDQVRGLDGGADDYVVKPFTFAVLVARVRALLRRREIEHPDVLRFDDLALDTGTRRASRGSRDIDLTATEYEVLRQFLLHPRRVLPKHFIMDRVWGYDMEGSSNVLEVYVKQLRQKLEANGEPRLIHTFRGAGYVLREA